MLQPAAAMLVHQLHYQALPTPYRADDETVADTALRFGGAIGRAARPHLDRGDCDDYVLAATLNSPLTSDPDALRECFRAVVSGAAGRAPAGQINAYECIGWALALRHAAAKAAATGAPRRVLLQIADADVHGLRATWETHTYGRARFGVTSVVVDVAPDAAVQIGIAPVERSMMKFAAALRQYAQRLPHAVLAVPFFPEPARSALHRALPGVNTLPDFHDRFGHCFGSDPWIAMALGRQRGEATVHHVVASLALNGYFGAAALSLSETASCSVEGMP